MITIKFIPETACFMFYEDNNNIMNIFQNKHLCDQINGQLLSIIVKYAEQLAALNNSKEEIDLKLEKVITAYANN